MPCSLRSKRLQSSYCAKVRAEAKKGWTCPSFLDEPRQETLATQARTGPESVKYRITRSPLDEGPSGVDRQPSNGLKFNHQPSKVQGSINISGYLKSHYFSWFLRTSDFWCPEESLNWKNQFPFSQKHSPWTLQDHTTCLYRSFICERPRQQVILIYTEVNV